MRFYCLVSNFLFYFWINRSIFINVRAKSKAITKDWDMCNISFSSVVWCFYIICLGRNFFVVVIGYVWQRNFNLWFIGLLFLLLGILCKFKTERFVYFSYLVWFLWGIKQDCYVFSKAWYSLEKICLKRFLSFYEIKEHVHYVTIYRAYSWGPISLALGRCLRSTMGQVAWALWDKVLIMQILTYFLYSSYKNIQLPMFF